MNDVDTVPAATKPRKPTSAPAYTPVSCPPTKLTRKRLSCATDVWQDLGLTARLREVGELCGITVLDHVVVAADGFISLAERGWM